MIRCPGTKSSLVGTTRTHDALFSWSTPAACQSVSHTQAQGPLRGECGEDVYSWSTHLRIPVEGRLLHRKVHLESQPRVKHSVGATVRPAPPRGKQLKCLLAAPHERYSAVHTCYAVEVLAHYNAAAGKIIAPMVASRTVVVDDLAERDCRCGHPAPAAAAVASLSTPLLEPLFDADLRSVERRVQIERDHPIIRHRY